MGYIILKCSLRFGLSSKIITSTYLKPGGNSSKLKPTYHWFILLICLKAMGTIGYKSIIYNHIYAILLPVKYLVRGIDEGLTFRGAEVCPPKGYLSSPLIVLMLKKTRTILTESYNQ